MKCFVFPLPQSNLYPLTTKPLNVFEPKYIQMVRDSIEQNIPIAIAYIPEFGDTYRKLAGYGHPQIVEERADGSLLVFVGGIGKIKITNEIKKESDLYIVAEAEIVQEDFNLDQKLKNQYMILSQLLVKWVQKHIPDPGQRELFVRSLQGPREVIGAFSAYLIRDYDMQYEMMEIFSLNEQIQFLYRLFESNELVSDESR